MISGRDVYTAVTVYGSAAIDQTTQQGLAAALTSSQISNYVILDITLGGWVTIMIMIGTLLLFIMNVSKFYVFTSNCIKRLRQKLRKTDEKEQT